VAFTDRFISEEQTARLVGLAAESNGLPGLVVEIGVWEGWSTCALARAVAQAPICAVDHWLGDLEDPDVYRGRLEDAPPLEEFLETYHGVPPAYAESRDVYGEFLRNVAELTAGNVCVHRQDWRDYAGIRGPVAHPGQPWARFVHLDGAHDYVSVRDQILTFGPRLVSGGVMAGDDWRREGVQRAVTELLTGYEVEKNLWWWRKP
jgi:hypothetical protein